MAKSDARTVRIIVQGASALGDVPGLEAYAGRHEVVFAKDSTELARLLPGSEVLLGWDFRGRDLADNWARATALKWIHWCGAGVDAVLFPELKESGVILTNSRGLFDRAMAEYALGYMLAEAKLFRATAASQANRQWQHRYTSRLAGQTAAIYGVGSIGREIARLLGAVGVNVCGIGRNERSKDPDFGMIYGSDRKLEPLAHSDWAIGILPSTPETQEYFDHRFFSAMQPTAGFINLGRGGAVVEGDLAAALRAGRLASAMLDVFSHEPLPASSELWDVPNLTVSPHMSGDYAGFYADIAAMFFANLERYISGKPLTNIVDKQLGFVPADTA